MRLAIVASTPSYFFSILISPAPFFSYLTDRGDEMGLRIPGCGWYLSLYLQWVEVSVCIDDGAEQVMNRENISLPSKSWVYDGWKKSPWIGTPI
jgi:hypothetical protein